MKSYLCLAKNLDKSKRKIHFVASLKRTPIFSWHKKHGEITNFYGWEMPIRIDNINKEHLAVRNNAGIFDVSHMGRFKLQGSKVTDFLNIIVVRELKNIAIFQAVYTFVLNDLGGFMDDIILIKLSNTKWLLICNASNTKKLWNWLNFQKKRYPVEIENITENTSMIALQGPNVRKILSKFTKEELPGRFKTKWVNLFGKKLLFSGTGYTGEDGGEIIYFGDDDKLKPTSLYLWQKCIEVGMKPCGLGSRDTLRLEAGFPLYGNDITEKTHLLESGLGITPFAHIEKNSNYIGKQAVLSKKGKIKQFRIFFKLLQKGVARKGYEIYHNEMKIGIVTSGTFSPLTREFIGMGYIPVEYRYSDFILKVKIRQKMLAVKIITPPAFEKSKYGATRTTLHA